MTATRALGSWLRARYGASLRNYWTCPQKQIFDGQAACIAEIHAGGHWRLVYAAVKTSGSTLRIEHVHMTTWRRRWSRYSKRVIRGFNTPGRAQVNSPAFDSAFLAAGAHYKGEKRHRRSFTTIAYDGNSSGYGKVFMFRCRNHGRVIQCTNAFGDSMKYRP